jgi:hypothetical protein
VVSTSEPERSHQHSQWRLHVTLLITLALCTLAFLFELHRALGGNSLSWAYVFEWPLLGVFAVYMWWRMGHPSGPKRVREVPASPQVDRMRAAWQESERVRQDGVGNNHSKESNS